MVIPHNHREWLLNRELGNWTIVRTSENLIEKYCPVLFHRLSGERMNGIVWAGHHEDYMGESYFNDVLDARGPGMLGSL